MNRFKAAISLILVCAMLFVVGACAMKQTKTTVTATQSELSTVQSQQVEQKEEPTEQTTSEETQTTTEKEVEEDDTTPLPQGAAEGKRAPNFTARLANGDTFRLSEHKDEVVLINFWATWCQPCVGELPELEKLYKEDMDGVYILTVNRGESESVVDDFLDDNGYTMPVAYDASRNISYLYPTQGIPYTLIISDGVVHKTFLGAPYSPYSAYKSAIEECM